MLTERDGISIEKVENGEKWWYQAPLDYLSLLCLEVFPLESRLALEYFATEPLAHVSGQSRDYLMATPYFFDDLEIRWAAPIFDDSSVWRRDFKCFSG
jgi:hypothetical protein